MPIEVGCWFVEALRAPPLRRNLNKNLSTQHLTPVRLLRGMFQSQPALKARRASQQHVHHRRSEALVPTWFCSQARNVSPGHSSTSQTARIAWPTRADASRFRPLELQSKPGQPQLSYCACSHRMALRVWLWLWLWLWWLELVVVVVVVVGGGVNCCCCCSNTSVKPTSSEVVGKQIVVVGRKRYRRCSCSPPPSVWGRPISAGICSALCAPKYTQSHTH